jgi:coenzyme F420-dependent glucose-6-phosphate dehydrogenase
MVPRVFAELSFLSRKGAPLAAGGEPVSGIGEPRPVDARRRVEIREIQVLQLGYKASAEQFGPRELLEFGILAERAGFDSVWVSDHFQPWRHTGGHAPCSLAWLGALGAATSRITLGTSVLTPTFRYHPSIVAQAFGTLGCLFPGRVILGVGSGESMNEVPSCGVVWPEQKERTARLREAVHLIGRLWREDRLSYRGAYYRTQNATVYDKPSVPVPLYVAAAGPVLAKFAGEVANGFICTSGKDLQLYTQTLLPNVDAGLAKAGRESGEITRTIEIKVSYDRNRDRALQDTRHWGALALRPEEKMNVEDPLDMERLADSLPLERAASRWIVSDDAAEVAERIWRYVDLGFTHLVFHAPGLDQRRFLEVFSSEVVPSLRSRAALMTGRQFRAERGDEASHTSPL